jgi:TolA-binding protein
MKKRIIQSAAMTCAVFCMLLGFASAEVAGQRTPGGDSDRMLFQQAKKALRQSKFAEARSLLQTLINTHPDSDLVARAKLSIADSWYHQHAFKRAKLEYQDIITFFPNRPEVREAQRQINSIQKGSE